MVELLIVMIVGSVLATIVSQGVGAFMRQRALDDSRAAIVRMGSRARALAIDRSSATLVLDPAAETIALVQDGDTLETVMLDAEYGVDLDAPATLSICYSSRGYAMASCTSFSADQTVRVRYQGESARLLVRPLGQMEFF